MKHITPLILSVTLLGLSARADILELKNGNVLNGKYAGGTTGTVRFETSAGQQVLETPQIIALTFTTPPPAPAPAPAPPPVAATSSVTLPYGTTLLVRMMDSVSSRNGPGANFTTRLEYNLVANDVVVAPAGTIIYGKVRSATQAGRAVGRSTLDIRLAQMIIGGSPVPIATSGYAEAGQASIAKAAKGAAFGATVGAIAGDAGKGAAIGATASLLKRGQTLTIPPGTLLEFTLTQPVTVRTGN
ncbi:MAG: hypothetical protein ABSC89_12790 [Verrucomicrobiota bacterium]|jgi:hypothetical protein